MMVYILIARIDGVDFIKKVYRNLNLAYVELSTAKLANTNKFKTYRIDRREITED